MDASIECAARGCSGEGVVHHEAFSLCTAHEGQRLAGRQFALDPGPGARGGSTVQLNAPPPLTGQPPDDRDPDAPVGVPPEQGTSHCPAT